MPTACGDRLFFNSKKKVGKKCRSHAPRGWHSAKRFVAYTTCVGLQGGLHNGCRLRDGLARCTRWFCLMVFWDGLVAMASLNDCVRSRGSLAGNIAHHMRTTDIQFGIRYAEKQFCIARISAGGCHQHHIRNAYLGRALSLSGFISRPPKSVFARSVIFSPIPSNLPSSLLQIAATSPGPKFTHLGHLFCIAIVGRGRQIPRVFRFSHPRLPQLRSVRPDKRNGVPKPCGGPQTPRFPSGQPTVQWSRGVARARFRDRIRARFQGALRSRGGR